MVLELRNVNKSFGKKQILHNVSFSVNEGEIMGFIGPNGAGKTTTIKLILGLQKIDSGEIKINGFDVKKDFENAIKQVGSIVENPDFYMYLSGRNNLKLTANLFRDINDDRIDEVAKEVGLENRIDDKVSKYSLGMRQRLGIADALLINPKLLILDEPTNGLDPEGIKLLRDILTRIAKEQKVAILVSSHNLSELESFCTSVCILQKGKVTLQSSIENLKAESNSIYTIRLNNIKGIEKYLNENEKILDNNIIEVHREDDEVSDLVKILLEDGYKIYETNKLKLTLEDAFLKKTGGNKID